MVLDASWHNTQHYKVQIKDKVEQWSSTFSSPWCSRYQKGSLQVTLDYSHQLYLLATYKIYLYALEHALESIDLSPPPLAQLSSFLQPKWNFLKHLLNIINWTFTFPTTNVFGCFSGVLAHVILVNHKISNYMFF